MIFELIQRLFNPKPPELISVGVDGMRVTAEVLKRDPVRGVFVRYNHPTGIEIQEWRAQVSPDLDWHKRME